MDGIVYEAHQFNRHWPFESGHTRPDELARAASWTLDNDLDYVFYYGPFQYKSCDTYYQNAERDWLNRYWAAGLPKKHPRMHYYINAFPHACGGDRPSTEETNPDSIAGFTKWVIEQVK